MALFFMRDIIVTCLGMILLSVPSPSKSFATESSMPTLRNSVNVSSVYSGKKPSKVILMGSFFKNPICRLKAFVNNDVNFIKNKKDVEFMDGILMKDTRFMKDAEIKNYIKNYIEIIIAPEGIGGKTDHNLKGIKWGACNDKSDEKTCQFNPFDECQFPRTEATITYRFISDGIKIEGGTQFNVDIAKLHIGYKVDFKSIIKRALSTWENCSGITFKEVNGSSSTADIRIGSYKLPINPKPGVGVTHARSYSPPRPHDISKEYFGDIYFNTDLTVRTSKDKIERQFYLISLHEIGHAIGLKHNNQRRSIMKKYSNELFSMEGLSLSDIFRSRDLYGGSSLKKCIDFDRERQRLQRIH